ncbi:MAG: hypothetical protein KGV56_05120 [Gammaproteobacteria bacterium]|nr:hypothetical protein [Gammaproteobacteria bacterium]
MKKLLLCTVLAGTCITNSFAGDLLKISKSSAYNDQNGQSYPIVEIVSKDDIEITKIVANRGNCEVMAYTAEEWKTKNAPLLGMLEMLTNTNFRGVLPLKMKYGQKTTFGTNSCGKNLLEIKLTTNKGEFTYEFE